MAKKSGCGSGRRRGLLQVMSLPLFALLAALLVQVGATPAAAQIGTQDNDILSLPIGASKIISLSENPSTGYRWQLDRTRSSNLAIVRVSDAGYQQSQSGLIGAPGTRRWQIEALGLGTARIVFGYSRPWEHEAPTRSYAVTVNIRRR